MLTEEELILFLTDLEKNMTDTAEFNFYGAHQIDFSTIINITARYKGYTLNLPKFIHDLKQGSIDELRQARIKIPQLFQSYRFLDYLLLQIEASETRYYLDNLRKQCQTPSWVKYTPLFVPEQFEFCWEIRSEPVIDEYVSKDERLRCQYIDTFFKSEPGQFRTQRINLLNEDESLATNGLVNEIEGTIGTKLGQ